MTQDITDITLTSLIPFLFLVAVVSFFLIILVCDFLAGFLYIFVTKFIDKVYRHNDISSDKLSNEKGNDPFILSFRKTRTETMIISRIEDIGKSRDIQFVISTYYYHNDKAINGCVYVITSKVLYKLFFIKHTLISREIHNFNTFISKQNKKYYSDIVSYLSSNNNYNKHKHHNEFYTWPHYYMINNYKEETEKLEKFLTTL